MSRVLKFISVYVALGVCSGSVFAQQPQEHKAAGVSVTTTAGKTATRYTQQFEQVALSPDGKTVAWIETQMNKQGAETGEHNIYVAEFEKNVTPRRISAGLESSRSRSSQVLTWNSQAVISRFS